MLTDEESSIQHLVRKQQSTLQEKGTAHVELGQFSASQALKAKKPFP